MIDVKKIPNYLCIFRIVVTPIIMFVLLYESVFMENFPFNLLANTAIGKFLADNFDAANSYAIIIAGVLFILAIITDAIDGTIARKYGAVSEKGMMLDPLADKVLIIGSLIAFFVLDYQEQKIMIFPLLIIALREIIVTVLRSFTAKKGVVVAANKWGKMKTLSQTVAIIIYFIAEFVHFPLYGQLAVIVAAFITLLSLFPYLFQFGKILTKK